MKQGLYNILDGEYCFLLDRIIEKFSEKKLNPTIVGGAAVQVHVANFLSKTHGKTIEELFVDDVLREQDHLRKTDDIDMAVYNKHMIEDKNCYYNTIREALEGLTGEDLISPDGNDLYAIHFKRRGLKRPVFLVQSLNNISEIRMNVSNSPEDLYVLDRSFYVPLVEEDSEKITLNYSSKYNPSIRLYNFQDVIAAKLANGRPKDYFDATVLGKAAVVAGEKIDGERIIEKLGGTPLIKQKVVDYLETLKE